MTYHKKVIEFSPSGPWSFWDFKYAGDASSPIEDWYQNVLSDDGKQHFDGLLKDVSKIADPIHWPIRSYLKAKYKDARIWELGFRADGRQYRILGVFGSVRKQAILLCGCYHKGKVYTPPDALDSAYRRSKELAEGRARPCVREIKYDI